MVGSSTAGLKRYRTGLLENRFKPLDQFETFVVDVDRGKQQQLTHGSDHRPVWWGPK